MLDKKDIEKIKETVEEFLRKMTISAQNIEAGFATLDKDADIKDVADVSIKIDEPQILIGEKGQTLFEIQRLLKAILNKKTGKLFYLNLDINDYKKKKTEYLKGLANDLAAEVALTKEEKILFPMPAYERRIIHSELSKRTDVFTESRGEGRDRYIVIKYRQSV